MIDLAPTTERTSAVVAAVTDDQLDAPTPMDQPVRVVIHHLLGLSSAFCDAAAKETGPTTSTPPAPADGPLPDGWRSELEKRLFELPNAWRSDGRLVGMTMAGGVDLPGEVCGLVAMDEVLLHGWDVARATGQPYQPTDAECEAVLPIVTPDDQAPDGSGATDLRDCRHRARGRTGLRPSARPRRSRPELVRGLRSWMRTIGLLGGMSWESTAIYYRLANELVRERLGGLHSARILMSSVDFAEVEELQVTGQWDRAGELLAVEAARLEAAGADLLVLCTNTMHKVADAIEDAVAIPLLHLGDVTAAAVRAAGLDTVGLLGTAFTMSQDFYRGRLESHGLQVLVPDEDDQALVHRVIYDELCQGVVREESRAAYVEVVERLLSRGAQGIILGCTEIEMLIGPDDLPVPSFPTTSIHVAAAVDAALD